MISVAIKLTETNQFDQLSEPELMTSNGNLPIKIGNYKIVHQMIMTTKKGFTKVEIFRKFLLEQQLHLASRN